MFSDSGVLHFNRLFIPILNKLFIVYLANDYQQLTLLNKK